jgi:hypothetical protein
MVAHDETIGRVLDKLDELGIADDTIVMYSTDNGPHYNSWPDAGITPFRSEKNTNCEGGWRVPAFVRWPGKIKAMISSGSGLHQLNQDCRLGIDYQPSRFPLSCFSIWRTSGLSGSSSFRRCA